MINEDFKLRKLYAEILLGYSPAKYCGVTVFIKHFSAIEQGILDGEYPVFYNEALLKGVPSEQDRVKILVSQEVWSEDKDREIEYLQRELAGKQDTKKHLAFDSQIDQVNKELKEVSSKLDILLNEKDSLVGLTAELFARKRVNELYILNSVFQDKKLLDRFYSDEDFDDLNERELSETIRTYNTAVNDLQGVSLRKIGLAPFFQDFFNHCDNNVYNFYGKPIAYLTFFQADLVKFGKFFKHVLSGESRPPQEIINDPDAIIDWYNKDGNQKKLIGDKPSSAVSIIGSAEDVGKMAQQQGAEVISLQEEARKKGVKKLGTKDLMKLLG